MAMAEQHPSGRLVFNVRVQTEAGKLEFPISVEDKGNPPVRAAGQAGRGFLEEGFLSQRFARAATSALSRSASKALGLKSSPSHSRVSAWRSWPGSSSASSISP